MKRRFLKILTCFAVAILAWLVITGIIIWNFGNQDNARKGCDFFRWISKM